MIPLLKEDLTMSNGHGGNRTGAGRPPKSGEYVSPEFTSMQLKELIDSPYVHSVSRKSVSYTKEFKDVFWQRYCDGIDPKQIFEDAGFNTKTITRSRMNGLIKALKNKIEKGQSFTEGSEPNLEQLEKMFNFPTPPRRANNINLPNLSEADMANLLNQVAYMSQELAFLKKIILANKEEK